MEEWPLNIQGYEFISPLGQGYFGIVWKVRVLIGIHKNECLALKKIDLQQCSYIKFDDIRKKILMLNQLNHKNLLSYKTAFISNSDLIITFAMMDIGSVEQILNSKYKNGISDIRIVATILKEALQGIEYLHTNGHVHREIKAANILLNQDGKVNVSDFGLTTKLKNSKRIKSMVGCPCWMSPEVLDDGKKYDFSSDIWSIGITAIELTQGKPPYFGFTTMKIIMTILKEDPPKLEVNENFDESFAEFVDACLKKNPQERKNISELLQMKFFEHAQSIEFLRDNFTKNLGSLEERVDQKIIQQGLEELVRIKQSQKLNSQNMNNQWDFNITSHKQQQSQMQNITGQSPESISKQQNIPKYQYQVQSHQQQLFQQQQPVQQTLQQQFQQPLQQPIQQQIQQPLIQHFQQPLSQQLQQNPLQQQFQQSPQQKLQQPSQQQFSQPLQQPIQQPQQQQQQFQEFQQIPMEYAQNLHQNIPDVQQLVQENGKNQQDINSGHQLMGPNPQSRPPIQPLSQIQIQQINQHQQIQYQNQVQELDKNNKSNYHSNSLEQQQVLTDQSQKRRNSQKQPQVEVYHNIQQVGVNSQIPIQQSMHEQGYPSEQGFQNLNSNQK